MSDEGANANRLESFALNLIFLGVAVVLLGYWGWTLMLILLVWMGPAHPPTTNHDVSLGTGRIALGWASLLFVPLGFTPMPFNLPT